MFHVYFLMSTGLKAPIIVPKGWTERVIKHVAGVESRLGIEREKYLDNPVHWKRTKFENVPDNMLCQMAETHNEWVRRTYHDLAEWSQSPPADGETLTPEQAEEFWPALEIINVPPERWTRDFYRARMQSLFNVMVGNEAEGTTFDEKPLSPRQAGAVILLFEQYLDRHDVRLSVPKGYDFLTEDYVWCERCGAAIYQGQPCSRKRCPLREEVAYE